MSSLSKILGWVVRNAPELLAEARTWAPIITEAAEIEPSVMAVIDQQAPHLRSQIETAVKGLLPEIPLLKSGTDDHEAAMETVATALFVPERWTPEAEKAWQDRMSGGS